MASIEGERNEEVVGQLTLEQKARLDEVMKQAELSLQSDELLNKAAAGKLLGNNYIAVSGVLSNYSKGPLTLVAQHQYSGSVIMDYTNPIDAADSNNNPGRGYFIMEGDGSVEAAAVYNGKNNKGDQDCGWLFGFNINKRIQPEKMSFYAVCGRMANFINPDWAAIKIKIEHGGHIGYYPDPKTGTQIYGGISKDPKTGRYSVSVAFYGA
uniref:Uncharacterized protein n=1 Tax=Oryza nivara TaxID=4536 RepID=A0A0E0J4G1_ORYNI